MQTLDIVRGQLEMPVVTSRPGSSEMRLGSEKPQSNKFIPVHWPDVVTNPTPIQEAKQVEPISFYPCMKYPYQITT